MKLNNNICNHLLIRSCLQPECLLASKTEYLEVLYTIETWKNDHTSNGKLNSLAVLSMHSEIVNELEWNNRPIKVFIELTKCGNVDTKVQTYTFSKSSSFTLSECINSTAKLGNLSSSMQCR